MQEQLVRVQRIQVNVWSFAAILEDGSVVTWGAPRAGGDSSQVREQLVRVQQIQATAAVAATLGDGSVVTWGDVDFGGDSRQVKNSWWVCSRSHQQDALLLPSWTTALWCVAHGVIRTLAVRAVRFRLSLTDICVLSFFGSTVGKRMTIGPVLAYLDDSVRPSKEFRMIPASHCLG